MIKKRIISMLVLLAAVVTGAMAETETLLTTITATAKEQASYSTANVATVSFSYTAGGSSAYLANWGWWGYGWSATVTAAEGYTITKCKFYDDADRTATDSEAPFVVETTEEDKTPRINGTPIDGGNNQSKGLKKIEVYGYVTPTATGYSVTLKDGTEDDANWKAKVGNGELQALPLTGLNGGETVTITYNGTKKVKSVKAVKKAAAAAYTMAANATAGDVGKLICTDGHIHAYSADAACTKSRVAMIAYVGIETGVAGYTHGLALALTDESSSGMYWNDAKTACTNKNTSATVESASWMLPSKDQWTNMIDACKNVLGTNNDSQDLRDGFTSVGGSNLESKDYWSSTERESYTDEAWMFNFGYDCWYTYPKHTEAYPQVRACLAF